ncbi:hypothetical protein KC315_g5843 [Hortaea werneckii]|nr:hypothetical protein KC315_g5843 [Hortaea werneckii]
MPTNFSPRKSGAHRVAAIALCRALLSQCRALPALEAEQRNALQNIVRNRFKQARYEQSTARLKRHFETGYHAIDRLDAAVAGDDASRTYILSALDQAPDKLKREPRTFLPKKLRQEQEKKQKAAARATEPATPKPSIFDRPLPKEQLSGRRHVPVLFNAQKMPVLRFKKPQPENLSGYIAHRARKTQRRHNTRHRIEDELEIAKAEDEWDRIIAPHLSAKPQQGGQVSRKLKKEDAEPRWDSAVRLAKKEISDKLGAEKERNREMRDKMQGIFDRERELRDKEKADGLREKKKAWRARTMEKKRGSAQSQAGNPSSSIISSIV